MTPEPTPLVTVLPCDRLAAEAFFPPHLWKGKARDDIAQAFARHRLAALEAAAKHFEALADMLDKRASSATDAADARTFSESAKMHRVNAAVVRSLAASNKGGRDGE